jgi:hypothetical protein
MATKKAAPKAKATVTNEHAKKLLGVKVPTTWPGHGSTRLYDRNTDKFFNLEDMLKGTVVRQIHNDNLYDLKSFNTRDDALTLDANTLPEMVQKSDLALTFKNDEGKDITIREHDLDEVEFEESDLRPHIPHVRIEYRHAWDVVIYVDGVMDIGCQSHTIEAWKDGTAMVEAGYDYEPYTDDIKAAMPIIERIVKRLKKNFPTLPKTEKKPTIKEVRDSIKAYMVANDPFPPTPKKVAKKKAAKKTTRRR